MAKTLIELDDALLAAAASALGTSTKRATVTAALEQAVADAARRRELAALASGAWAEAGELADTRSSGWAR